MARQKTISELDAQRICSAVRAGFSSREIARLLNMQRHHVRYWAKKLDVQSRNRCPKPIKASDRQEIEMLLRSSGFSYRKIGVMVGVSYETVRTIYQEIGSPQRPEGSFVRCEKHGKSTVWPCPICEVDRYLAGKNFRTVRCLEKAGSSV